MRTFNVGDVIAVRGTTNNPYKASRLGNTLCGEPRKTALTAFKHGKPTPNVEWWGAPAEGGATKITKAQVRWETSGVE